jgi:ParB-like chromosome segregation protein Spo0J
MTTLTKPAAARTLHDLTDHPLADIFPLMEGDEFAALVEDIKANGLREPITLYEDKILDGRNRYRAVVKAEMQYRLKEENFRPYTGSDPLGFVVSANLHRRHLNESQRAAIAAKLVTTTFGSNQYNKATVGNKQAAIMLGVSEATVKMAKEVAKKAAPEISQLVQKGELRLGAAKQLLNVDKSQQVAELEKIKAAKQKEKEDKTKQRTGATKGNTGTKASKANQAMKEVDEFCKKWKSFDNNQRRAFVDIFKVELAALLDAIQQQEAMIGAAA